MSRREYVLVAVEVKPRRRVDGARVAALLTLIGLFLAAQACNRDQDGYPVDSPLPRASQVAIALPGGAR